MNITNLKYFSLKDKTFGQKLRKMLIKITQIGLTFTKKRKHR